MKCPICGQQLRPGKKDPNYLLCYNCKKKFKNPQVVEEKEEEQKYSNIPPKHVREKRETEMRKAYDEMLAAEDDGRKKRKPQPQPKAKAKEEYVDNYDNDYNDDYDYEDDENLSRAPIIILGIAILVVAAVIVWMLIK